MYFFKDDSYYLFNGKKLDIEDGYPRLITDKWHFCSDNLLEMNFESAAAATVPHSIVYLTLAVCLLLVMRPH